MSKVHFSSLFSHVAAFELAAGSATLIAECETVKGAGRATQSVRQAGSDTIDSVAKK